MEILSKYFAKIKVSNPKKTDHILITSKLPNATYILLKKPP
jgi:hypothetical protein